MLSAIGRIIGYTLAGALALPLVALVFAIVIWALDPRCGTPGDSGGCEMGLGAMVIMAVPAGAGLGFLIGVWRAVRARRLTRGSIP
ncbi:MAG: hypothetical protein ACK4UO_14905 [Pseudolabrys sp.]